MVGTAAWPIVRPVADVATRVGLRAPRPADDARFPIDHVYRLWAEVARVTDPTLPVEVARRIRLDDLGLMGFVILTAPSGHDALALAVRFAPLINDSGVWSVDSRGELVTVTWHRDGERSLGHRVANEAGLGEFVACVRQLCGPRFAPLGVQFRHRAPASTAAHRAFFGCPVDFDAGADAFWFHRRALDVVPAAASPGLAALVRAQADARLATLAGSTSARARDAIARALRQGERPAADAIARALGLAGRTLRRRLAAEGSGLARLVDDAVRERALTLVDGGRRPLTEIAIELGFSDSSAFSHAFRRWHGCSPRELRSRRREPGCRAPA